MSTRAPASVSAVVVAYNGGTALRECVEALLHQTVQPEIIVVDNASTDGSVDQLEIVWGPRVHIVRQKANRGYAAGANAGWHAASAEVVAVLNQDLVPLPDCLERMREVLLVSDQEALVTPKLVLRSDRKRVNAVGNEVHLSGVAWCHGLDTPAEDWHGWIEVTAISGAAFMARVEFLRELDGLEEEYFMYMEDVDLSLRARIAGAICLAACDAVAVHDWRLAIDADKFELLERNRRALWRRFWQRRRGMLPLLVQAELMAWLYAAIKGRDHLRAKMRADRAPLRLRGFSATESSVLLGVLAKNHPYRLFAPRSRVVAGLGRMADIAFCAAARRSISDPSGSSHAPT